MKKVYDRNQAAQLVPLLRSIAEEIEERSSEVVRIEALSSALAPHAKAHEDEISNLRAEGATHRYELRRALTELEQLGCTLADLDTLTIHIPGPRQRDRGFDWSPSAPGMLREHTRVRAPSRS